METNLSPSQFSLRRRILVVAFFIGTAALSLMAYQVGAGREEPSPDVAFTLTQMPGCSYGYGQCVKSCDQDDRCLQNCNFLYNDCREPSAFWPR